MKKRDKHVSGRQARANVKKRRATAKLAALGLADTDLRRLPHNQLKEEAP